jgi:RecA-family ATPase
MAMLDAATAASDPRVRRLLRALERLAAKHGCAIVLVRHLNKGSGRPALYRGTGLLAFTAVCRLGWLVARDPADPSRRVLAEMASNLAPPQPSLAFRLVSHADSGQPLVEWLGPSTWGREELLAWRGLRAERRARAAVLLKDLLKDGPRQSADVWQAARAHHLSRSTVRRAKGDVNVQCQRVMHDGRQLTFWLLPDQQIPPQYRPQPGSLDEMLDRINRMFPRRPNDDDDDLDDEAA